MSIRRAPGAMLLLSLIAPAIGAQDVIEIGRRNGVAPPQAMLRELARNPNAYEFERAWKSSLEQVRANRARMQARGARPEALSVAEAARQGVAVQGSYKVPVLLIRFSDTGPAPYHRDTLQRRLYDGPGAPITLSQMYSEMSRGLFQLSGTVSDWVSVSKTGTYYEGTDNGSGPEFGELLKEVLDSADKTIDFSVYDRDGDGYVDFAAFVHPDQGGECGTPHIWSHRWTYGSATGTGAPYQTNDGVRISDYVVQPALNCSSGGPATVIDIGVFAHEFGHALGLPDLYATADPRPNAGIGVWGLMGAGNWNRPESPAHMEAWSKAELGWIPVRTLSASTTGVSLTAAATTGEAIRIDVPNSSEYFLLENRQRVGAEQHLVGTGLLIWHVDSATIASRSWSNTVQNQTAHKGLDLEEADGRNDLDAASGRADAGDPFPGSSARTAFHATTSPNSNGYGGVASGISIRNIVEASGVVTFDVGVGGPGEQVVYWGDVNGDGVVNADDAQGLYDHLIGKSVTVALAYADVDGSGTVDARDALIVHSFAVGGIDVSTFRVGKPVTASAVGRPLQPPPGPVTTSGERTLPRGERP